jgi:hypothetical protein
MKKASILLIAIFMAISLIACNEGSQIQNGDALMAADSESGDSSDVSTDDVLKNVALGKKYALTGIYTDPNSGKEMYGDSEVLKLTDGVTGSKEDITYVSPVWVGLNIGGKDADKDQTSTTVTVDLKKTEENLSQFTVYAEECEGGVGAPKWVEVFVSEDNENYSSLGTLNHKIIIRADTNESSSAEGSGVPDDRAQKYGIYYHSLELTDGVRARYVKFEITHSVNWVFVSEVEVLQTQSTPKQTESESESSQSASEESKTISQAESKSESKAESKSESKAESKSESKVNSETDIDDIEKSCRNIEVINKAFLKADCLEDLYDIIRNHSTLKVAKVDPRSCVMYKGDGFNTLIFFSGSGWTEALVEDYRDRTFTLYQMAQNNIFSYNRFFLNGLFDICGYGKTAPDYDNYRKKLDESATSEKTLKLFDFLSTENAFLDFAEFYSGSKLDSDKVFRYVYSAENVIRNLNTGYVFDLNVQRNVGYDILNVGLFKELLKVCCNQDFQSGKENYPKLSHTKTRIADNSVYTINCNTFIEKDDRYENYFELEIGVSDDGKKYLLYMDRYAYLDDVSYNKICEICNTLWHNYTDIYGIVEGFN